MCTRFLFTHVLFWMITSWKLVEPQFRHEPYSNFSSCLNNATQTLALFFELIERLWARSKRASVAFWIKSYGPSFSIYRDQFVWKICLPFQASKGGQWGKDDWANCTNFYDLTFPSWHFSRCKNQIKHKTPGFAIKSVPITSKTHFLERFLL